MAIDQNLIPKDLRPLNINRTVVVEDPRFRPPLFFPPPPAAAVAPSADPVYASLGFVNPVPVPASLWPPRPAHVLPPLNLAAMGPAQDALAFAQRPPVEYTGEDGSAAAHADERQQPPSARKVKLLCGFGGKILPRPSDGALRYVGGQTRIISVRRDVAFPEFMQKMVDIYGPSVIIKYQLPGEDLDALVTVSSGEDLENMMDEYEKLAESSLEGSAKLRVFVLSGSEVDSPAASGILQFDMADSSQRYVEAVNGIPEVSNVVALRRKESGASVSSTHSDGLGSTGGAEGADSGANPGHLDGELPGAPPATIVLPHEGSRIVYFNPGPNLGMMPVTLPQMVTAPMPQPLQPGDPERTAYVQAYLDPHQVDYSHSSSRIVYANPQQVGVVRPIYRENVVGVSLPYPHVSGAVHLAPSPASPRAGLKVNVGQHFVHRTDTPYVDVSTTIGAGRVVQIPADQFFQPQIQHPATVHGSTVEHCGWRPVPPPPPRPPQPEQLVKREECCMCQKALPHAHFDTMLHEPAYGIAKTISEPNQFFQSHNSEESTRPRNPFRVVVTGEMSDDGMDQPGEGMNKLGYQGAVPQAQPRLVAHADSGVHEVPVRPQIGRIKFSQPLGEVTTISTEGQTSYGMYVGKNIPHSNYEEISQAGTVPLQLKEGFVRDLAVEYPGLHAGLSPKEGTYESCSSYDHIRPLDVKMEALHVNSAELMEQYKSTLRPDINASMCVNPESVPAMMNNGTRLADPFAMPVGNASAFIKQPGVIPDGTYITPVELLPTPLEVPTNFHNYQNVEPRQVSPPSANPETSVQSRVNFVPPVSDEVWQGKPVISGIDSAHLTGEKIPLRIVNDVPSFPVGTSPTSVSTALPGVVGDNWNPAASNTLFSSQDPWSSIQQAQQVQFLPPHPSNVAGKGAYVARDSGSESRFANNGVESSSKTVVDEGMVHQPTERLNQDMQSDTTQFVKGSVEEQIKQDFKAVAEGVAASVLQTSMHSGPLPSTLDASQPDDQSIQERDPPQNNGEGQNPDVESKYLDKAISGLLITEDINRLQIIKNSDLEELRELGSGTFGTVYHGKWRGTDVAIKRINDRCFAGKPSEQERLRADFWNEACKLADLHHPNVVAFYGVVLDGPGGTVATVTEFMVNGSLRHALQRNDRILDRRKRLLIAMDVAFGMEYLHGKNIVHFDLKSDNLLVNLRDAHRPICKVGDLGLSKVKCQTLISGGVRGTLPWMAPELLNGSSSLVSEKVDVFSFGIVMWELLTGEEPYADLHYGAIIGGIVSNTLRPLMPESCDPEWRSLMEHCWSSEPSERPGFTEIASKLRAMAASLQSKDKPNTHKNEAKGFSDRGL